MLSEKLHRRDLLMLLGAMALSPRVRAADSLLKINGLDHINLRASNPAASAHFYQSLFGGELLWAESIQTNPYSPRRSESWFLGLGTTLLGISPTFPTLGPGLDHICPTLQDYEFTRTADLLEVNGLAVHRALMEIWLRDPDEILWQLHKDSAARPSLGPKPGDKPARGPAAFVPLSIREITLRSADPDRTSRFCTSVFGGEVDSVPGSGRTIRFGQSVLRIVPAVTAMDRGFYGFGVRVRDFSPDAARRALQERRIARDDEGGKGEVHFTDPDGIHVQVVTSV